MKLFFILGCSLVYVLTFFSSSQDNELNKSITRGKELYVESCINCHLANGEGVKGTFPPLAKADYLVKYQQNSIRAIKFGMTGAIKVNGETYNNAMPPAGLADDEVADVMNYINNSFGNKNTKIVTVKMVADVKEK